MDRQRISAKAMGIAAHDPKEICIKCEDPVIVLPEDVVDHGTLYLSPLDRQAPLFMYILFAYTNLCRTATAMKGNGDGGASALGMVLKNALPKLLMLYYPAAGRIKLNQETGYNEIACSGKGVMFVEAFAHGLEVKDIFVGNENMRQIDVNSELENKFVYQLRPTCENPLVVIQVTKFSCGGFTLGFGWRHELFDGNSAAQFLSAWADIARGEPLPTIKPPYHNRTLLQPQQFSKSNYNPVELRLEQIIKERFFGIPILKGEALTKNTTKSWESTLTDFSSSLLHPDLYVTKMFTVPEKMVAALKRQAMACASELSSCSTFDVITAHAWLSRVKAMEINPCERILLEFAVDARSKTNPPLPENFIGNAFVMAFHNCKAEEILNSSFQNIVKRIQQAKGKISDFYIGNNLCTLEKTDTKALPSFRETSIVTDWTKFQFGQDFGSGRPVFLTPVAMPLPDVIFVIRSARTDPDSDKNNNISVRLGLLQRHMDKFEQLFLDFPSIV